MKKKYQNGGEVEPYRTSNPQDPRFKQYADSLSAYKKSHEYWEDFKKKSIIKPDGSVEHPVIKYPKIKTDIKPTEYRYSKNTNQVFPLYPKPKQEVVFEESTPKFSSYKKTVIQAKKHGGVIDSVIKKYKKKK
jgi:hypothetical protein